MLLLLRSLAAAGNSGKCCRSTEGSSSPSKVLLFCFILKGRPPCKRVSQTLFTTDSARKLSKRKKKEEVFQKWAAQLNFRSETRCYLHLWRLFREREQILINVLKKHKNKRQASSLSADESGTWFFFSSICTVWRLWPCSCDIASGILSSIHS